jgi:hypothetical protein
MERDIHQALALCHLSVSLSHNCEMNCFDHPLQGLAEYRMGPAMIPMICPSDDHEATILEHRQQWTAMHDKEHPVPLLFLPDAEQMMDGDPPNQ